MSSFESPHIRPESNSTAECAVSGVTEAVQPGDRRLIEEIAPGACNCLQAEFNLRHLDRYPLDVLKTMFEQKDQSGDWGVMIYPKDDHNGAFRHAQQIDELARTVHGSHRLRIIECDTVDQSTAMLADLASRFGPASFACICAHGTPDSISFSEGPEEGILTREAVQETFGGALGAALTPEAEICLMSCSTAVEGGIADEISEAADRKTTGPDGDTNIVSFGAQVRGDRVQFSPRYRGAVQASEALSR